jgi:hypothetical protein
MTSSTASCRRAALVLTALAVALDAREARADDGSPGFEEDRRPPPPGPPARDGFAVVGSYGVVNGHHAQVFRALELHAVAPLSRTTLIGVVAGIDEGIATPIVQHFPETRGHALYDHAYWDVWFGPQLAWGAPFRSASRWGVSLQSGVTAGVRDRTLYSGFGNDEPARYVGVFGAVSLRLAVCGCKTLRPFVGASGRTVVGHFGDYVQSAGIDLGLAIVP